MMFIHGITHLGARHSDANVERGVGRKNAVRFRFGSGKSLIEEDEGLGSTPLGLQEGVK